MDSILNTVKKALGVEEDYDGFDTNIILEINSALSNLQQLGVGPSDGFVVVDENETWTQLLGPYSITFEQAKIYILDKVRLGFDPPTNSFLVDAIQKQIQELEWRLMVRAETPTSVEETILVKREAGVDNLDEVGD